MEQFVRTQSAAVLVLLGVYLTAEAARMTLSLAPGSEWAWYLNIETFRLFAVFRASDSPFGVIFDWSPLIPLAVVAVAVAAAEMLNWRLGLAIVSNGCAMLAADITYRWFSGSGHAAVASLDNVGSSDLSEVSLLTIVCAASALALISSHLSYLLYLRKC
jgi:hypothetical protein